MSRRKKVSKNAPCMEGSRKDHCPHFLECGGCKYQKMTYEEQLAVKEQELRELFEPVFKGAGSGSDASGEHTDFDKVWEGIKESPVREGYRNKMEFSFGDEYLGGPLALGMHKRGSHFDIVSVTECRIAHPDMRLILKATLKYFRDHGTPFFHRVRHEGYLRHLLIRRAYHTGEILVDLVTTSDGRGANERLIAGWRDAVLACGCEGSIAGILHTVNDRIADVVCDQGTDILYGRSEFTEELLGLKFSISPFSFFQTNSSGAEVLYETAREFFMDGAEDINTLYDLYSGTGTIAQLLSPAAKNVVGVELIPEAVDAAQKSAEKNGIKNCRFIAGDVLKVIDDLKTPPEAIILDPPRDGVNPKALKKILSYNAGEIVYIACRPASLARDYEVFRHAGYEVKRMVGVDMFPFTRHVETVALLSKLSEAKYHIEVKVDMDELDLTSAEAKATYKEIQDWVQEKYGVHVTNLNIAQVKQKHGIIERENYNKPKSSDSKQPGCPEEKVKAIEDAMRYFQMI